MSGYCKDCGNQLCICDEIKYSQNKSNKTMLKNLEYLLDAILTTHTVTCSKCKDLYTVCNYDDYAFVESLNLKGWKATSHNVYCPKCNKKRLEKKV